MWREYIAKFKEIKGESKHQQTVAEEKPAPTGGLNALLTARLWAKEPICSPEETADPH